MKKLLSSVFLLGLSILLVACGPKVLEEAKASLEINYQTGDTSESVTKDLTLPTSLENHPGVTIEWNSDKTEVVTVNGTEGKVKRPKTDTTVNLTATLKYENQEDIKTFSVKIIKEEVVAHVISIKSKYGESNTNDITDGDMNEHLVFSKSDFVTVIFSAEQSKTKNILNNKFSEIRLYPGSKDGSKLTIKANSGKKIIKLEIVMGPQNAGLSINGGEANQTVSKKIEVDVDSLESVTLQNVVDATKSNRIDIKEIIVTVK